MGHDGDVVEALEDAFPMGADLRQSKSTVRVGLRSQRGSRGIRVYSEQVRRPVLTKLVLADALLQQVEVQVAALTNAQGSLSVGEGRFAGNLLLQNEVLRSDREVD